MATQAQRMGISVNAAIGTMSNPDADVDASVDMTLRVKGQYYLEYIKTLLTKFLLDSPQDIVRMALLIIMDIT